MSCTATLKHLTILLVEDEPTLAHLLRDAIGDRFARFELAYDGQEGLSRVEEVRPDFVITDITMPHMNGLEMSSRLHEATPDLPIIILSAYSEKEYLLDAINIGITKYLIKPFDPDELLDVICTQARKRRQAGRIPLMPPFAFDAHAQKLFRDDTMVRLSRRENLFFDHLVSQPNHFLAADAIKAALWGDATVSDERLRVFINRLRHKTAPELIENIVGQGYLLQTRPKE